MDKRRRVSRHDNNEEEELIYNGADEKDLFCPVVAVSRYPYKFLNGDLSQKVAAAFFDQKKFWNRPWDL